MQFRMPSTVHMMKRFETGRCLSEALVHDTGPPLELSHACRVLASRDDGEHCGGRAEPNIWT